MTELGHARQGRKCKGLRDRYGLVARVDLPARQGEHPRGLLDAGPSLKPRKGHAAAIARGPADQPFPGERGDVLFHRIATDAKAVRNLAIAGRATPAHEIRLREIEHLQLATGHRWRQSEL